MKSLLLLAVFLGALFAAGCACKDTKYPSDTYIGSSGWPASQVPITKPAK